MKWIVDNWFEITTAFVAVVALVQPWIAKWFHEKKSKIEIIPNRFFDIGFNKRGIYIILYATVISKHTESILSAIKIKILKNNNCLYELESDIFMNPYIQSYSSGGQSIDFSSATYAYPIYLNKSKPDLLKIQFIDYDVEKKVSHAIQKNNRNNLLLQCKFEAGDYQIVFELSDTSGKIFKSKYSTVFNDSEVKLLQACVDKVLNNETHNQITLAIQRI